MRYDQTIYLSTTNYTVDELKQQIKSYSFRKVFANKYTINKAEFSAAGQLGLKAEFAFNIRTIEYSGEEFVAYEYQLYHVYRTQEAGERITLYLSQTVADSAQQKSLDDLKAG